MDYLRNLWQQFVSSISDETIAIFFRQFATLITAGISLTRACDLLEKSQTTQLNDLIKRIKKDMLAGKTFAFCLKQHPRYFTTFTCQLIYIGEQTGKLELILTSLAEHLEKKLQFKKQLRQALFYPCIILVTAFLITLMMFIFVVPKFALLFADMNQQLPFLTLIIFDVALKLKVYGSYFLSISLLSLILIIYFKKKFAHLKLNLVYLKLPLLKAHFHKMILIHFSRNLALTFASGMAITEALKISGEISFNHHFLTIVGNLILKIRSGLPLYYCLSLFPIFPPLMIQMVKIGEESGQLDYMLNKTADFFEAEIEQLIKYFTQLLEPLIMLVLGVLIGGLILGMYLPIFKLGNAF